jgi:hypothetical protein
VEPTLSPQASATSRLGELLARAAADGHTALAWSIVASALSGAGLDAEAVARDAVATGQVAAVLLGQTRAVALTEHVVAEQRVADAVADLVDRDLLRVCPAGTGATSADGTVIDRSHELGSADLGDRLEQAGADAPVLLVGDPDRLGPFGPGAPFRDLLTAAQRWAPHLVVTGPKEEAAADDDESQVTVVRAALRQVRAGELPDVATGQHGLVVIRAPDDAALAHRVTQLVSDSIPRVFGLSAGQICVVTPLVHGACGVATLRPALSGHAEVRLVHELDASTWPAVVAVFPAQSAGVIDRPLVLSAMTPARRHLSIAACAGVDMAATLRLPHRRRTTILPTLLAGWWQPTDLVQSDPVQSDPVQSDLAQEAVEHPSPELQG